MNDRGSLISTDQTDMRTARKKAKPRANETLGDAILRLATAGQGLDAIASSLEQQELRPNVDRLPIARQLRTTRFAEVRRKRDRRICSAVTASNISRRLGLDSLSFPLAAQELGGAAGASGQWRIKLARGREEWLLSQRHGSGSWRIEKQ